MKELILHTPDEDSGLERHYRKAFLEADVLLLVSAYLTNWDSTLKLNSECKRFRVIVGSDFGITKKQACRALLQWLPSDRKAEFFVAESIQGFHPKALFWKTRESKCFAIIGSSNLTVAAFRSNFEANVLVQLTEQQFSEAEKWIHAIENSAVVVSEDWIAAYQEAPPSHGRGRSAKKRSKDQTVSSAVALRIPKPAGSKKAVQFRRDQIARHGNFKKPLLELFESCASGKISSEEFYDNLQRVWGNELGNRLQGKGWERQGKSADFQAVSASFLEILDASPYERDDVVRRQLDVLHGKRVRARKAFLSEMLCLQYPMLYPVLNRPVAKYLKAINFRKPSGASEGAAYIDLAVKLRQSIRQNPNHPAKSIAELDAVLWKAYGDS